MTEQYRHPVDPKTAEFFPSWGSVLAQGRDIDRNKVYGHDYNVDNIEVARKVCEIPVGCLIQVTGPAINREETRLKGQVVYQDTSVGIWTEVTYPNPKAFKRKVVANV